jgi:RNA polymerase primary sigma factor
VRISCVHHYSENLANPAIERNILQPADVGSQFHLKQRQRSTEEVRIHIPYYLIRPPKIQQATSRMKFRRVLTVAATACCVNPSESFAPPRGGPQDHLLSEHLSELHYSAVEASPETKPLASRRTLVSATTKTRRKVQQLEPKAKNRRKVQQLEPKAAPDRSMVSTTTRRNREVLERQYQRATRTSSPGLTRDQEVSYSFLIRTLRATVRLRDQLVLEKHGGQLSEAAWAEACGVSVKKLRSIVQKGQAARAAVVNANVGLVTSFAKRQYTSLKTATEAGGGVGTILSLQDMIQEGNLGLMEAAERFEPEKGFRFSTYATWWVRQRILRSISDSSRTIRLPAHVHTMLQKIRKAKTEIKSQLGREPTSPELANHLDVSEEKLQLYAESSRNVISLNRPLKMESFQEDSRTLGDTLASDAPTPEEDAEADYLRRDIRAVMDKTLAEREREVIVNRFGLEDGKPRTVAETAQSLGITRDRVRLVEAKALNKLRHPQRNYKLKDYIFANGNKENERPGFSCYHPREDVQENGRKEDLNRIWFF